MFEVANDKLKLFVKGGVLDIITNVIYKFMEDKSIHELSVLCLLLCFGDVVLYFTESGISLSIEYYQVLSDVSKACFEKRYSPTVGTQIVAIVSMLSMQASEVGRILQYPVLLSTVIHELTHLNEPKAAPHLSEKSRSSSMTATFHLSLNEEGQKKLLEFGVDIWEPYIDALMNDTADYPIEDLYSRAVLNVFTAGDAKFRKGLAKIIQQKEFVSKYMLKRMAEPHKFKEVIQEFIAYLRLGPVVDPFLDVHVLLCFTRTAIGVINKMVQTAVEVAPLPLTLRMQEHKELWTVDDYKIIEPFLSTLACKEPVKRIVAIGKESPDLVEQIISLLLSVNLDPIVSATKTLLTAIEVEKGMIDLLENRCSNVECAQTSKSFRTCAGCRYTYYCSKSCQQADWKAGHKANCKELKEYVPESVCLTRRNKEMTVALKFLQESLPRLMKEAPEQHGVELHECFVQVVMGIKENITIIPFKGDGDDDQQSEDTALDKEYQKARQIHAKSERKSVVAMIMTVSFCVAYRVIPIDECMPEASDNGDILVNSKSDSNLNPEY